MEENIKNLYYLDEMIKDMINCNIPMRNGEKYQTFLKDWYLELKQKVGHTDQEREQYLRSAFGDSWFEDGNFLSIQERDEFLEVNSRREN